MAVGYVTAQASAVLSTGGDLAFVGDYDRRFRAVDVKNGLIVLSTGNPNPDYQGETRPGANAYTDSILALHAKELLHTGVPGFDHAAEIDGQYADV